MSLTSCFKYGVELPESTLTSLLRTIIAQGETAGLPTTYTATDVPVGDYTANVEARLEDDDTHASSFELTNTDLEAILHLFMRIGVTIVDLPGLDEVVYHAQFALPGEIYRMDTTAPPELRIKFPGVTESDLGLVLSDAAFTFTPALFEDEVHAMYAANPSLQHSVQPNTNVPPFGALLIQVWIYDDPPGSMDGNGSITVEIPQPMRLRVNLPGRIAGNNISGTTVLDYRFVASVGIDIVSRPAVSGGDELVVELSGVTTSDIDITWGTPAPPSPLDLAIELVMKPKIVTALTGIDDPVRPIPSNDQVRDQIAAALLDYAASMEFPFLPLAATADMIDLGSSVPTTVAGSALALQIESEPGAPCVGPDDYVGASAVALAMGAPEVQRRLDAGADDIAGTSTHVGGYDVTINRPAVSLADAGENGQTEGHIWVSGTAVVHVGGCVGDVDADYWGPLFLTPVNNPDGTISFDVRAGTFGGDTDAKDKKDDFDPAVFETFIAGWDFSFPTLPGTFEGVGTIALNITVATISRAGIVLTGGVTIQRLNALMSLSVLPTSLFWAFEAPQDP